MTKGALREVDDPRAAVDQDQTGRNDRIQRACSQADEREPDEVHVEVPPRPMPQEPNSERFFSSRSSSMRDAIRLA